MKISRRKMHLRDRIICSRILILGAGRSGMAAARLLRHRRIPCLVVDEATPEKLWPQARELHDLGIPFDFGKLSAEIMEEIGLLVLSPGIPLTNWVCQLALSRRVPIISELELGYQFTTTPIIAITGTNGKTTTTHLIAHILRQAGYQAVEAGNIGQALCDVCRTPAARQEKSILVVEVSSFQLETIVEFRPHIAVLLNLSTDHLERYATVSEYIAAKRRLLMNLTGDDYLVTNADDASCREFAESTPAKVMFFSTVALSPKNAVWVENGEIYERKSKGKKARLCEISELRVRGMHNVENVIAGAATGLILGVQPKIISESVRSFSPIEHRLEFVAAVDGVEFYNDSKATNLNSLEKALDAFDKPVILIAGGRSKREDFKQLAPRVRAKVRAAILLGETAEEIQSCWQQSTECFRAQSMEEAIRLSIEKATSGEVVLLSPGCPSYDMYRNFEERGADFKNTVLTLLSRLGCEK